MFNTVVTIVGKDLDRSTLNYSMKLIKELNVENISYDILKDEYAADILVSDYSEQLLADIRTKLSDVGTYDIFAQKNNHYRKKKLLVCDLESTVIKQELLDEIAGEFGLKREVADITKRGMLGEIDFKESLSLRLQLLKGKPITSFSRIADIMTYNDGVTDFVKVMRKFGAKAILVSGGFDIFAEKVAHEVGFYKSFANKFEIEDGCLTGNFVPPLIDRNQKEQILVDEAKLLDLKFDEVMSVGDGGNDIGMLQRAGAGIGYFAKPNVVEVVPHQIKHTDFMTLLYMQGYKYSEFAFDIS